MKEVIVKLDVYDCNIGEYVPYNTMNWILFHTVNPKTNQWEVHPLNGTYFVLDSHKMLWLRVA